MAILFSDGHISNVVTGTTCVVFRVMIRAMNSDQANATSPQRVLLADDDEVHRIYVTAILTRGGYQVVQVENGQQALEKMQQEHFSLLVTDWEMPILDGLGLCRAVRANNSNGYTYIVMLTSRSSVDHIVVGLQSGADDYLSKPIVEAELLARLNAGRRLIEMEQSLRRANENNLRLSTIDALTGTFNRRHLMDSLTQELHRSIRYNHPLSLLVCDLDHFKLINDIHGHPIGDDALCHFVQVIRSSLRQSDWIARYGGEEFVIVLTETPLAAAAQVAERCRSTLENSPLLLAGKTISMTASFGVSGWDGAVTAGTDAQKLIALADVGAYASKNGGRNRVTTLTNPIN